MSDRCQAVQGKRSIVRAFDDIGNDEDVVVNSLEEEHQRDEEGEAEEGGEQETSPDEKEEGSASDGHTPDNETPAEETTSSSYQSSFLAVPVYHQGKQRCGHNHQQRSATPKPEIRHWKSADNVSSPPYDIVATGYLTVPSMDAIHELRVCIVTTSSNGWTGRGGQRELLIR